MRNFRGGTIAPMRIDFDRRWVGNDRSRFTSGRLNRFGFCNFNAVAVVVPKNVSFHREGKIVRGEVGSRNHPACTYNSEQVSNGSSEFHRILESASVFCPLNRYDVYCLANPEELAPRYLLPTRKT